VTAGITAFGDSAWVIEVADVGSAHRLAAVIERWRRDGQAPEGVEDAVVGLASVVVHLAPWGGRADVVEEWLVALGTGPAGPMQHQLAGAGAPGPRHVDIPVTFDGPDMEEVADMIGATPADVAGLVTSVGLQVAFVGFAPGFPYLVGLPEELAAIPRRATPRAAVPSGSVAVGGGFASVYPQSSPGGWMLVGRTTVPLFDPRRPPYALLSPGDTVRFSHAGTDGSGPGPPPSPARPPLTARGERFVEVLEPGLLSLVEDGGRRAVGGLGVPRAGPADPEAMRLANRLVGNPDDAAAIEVTAVGPTLRFAGAAHVGVVASPVDGVEVRIDGHPVSAGAASPVRDGQVVAIGRVLGGLRAYVAVSGGLETPVVVGSRSTDVLSGLGPGPLAAGDRLDLGPAGRPHGQVLPPADGGRGGRPALVRVMAGPHRHPGGDVRLLTEAAWTVGDQSNRIGVRLTGPRPVATDRDVGIPSVGMVTGAVQLPPDGDPIVLGPDHATVGGYPVVACVISADLPVVGQLRPGDAVHLVLVDRATARSERLRWERGLAGRVAGWFPTEVAT
jgi:KipI family sensor histidine kinase inhibitor